MRPCPFCDSIHIRWSAEKFQGHRFKCTKCHAVGPFSDPDRGATARETSDIRTEAAAKLWNKRPAEDAALTLVHQWEHDAKFYKKKLKEAEMALDAYKHGPPAESQQLLGALNRIKELEAEKNEYEEARKLINEAAALISNPEFKNECDRLRERLAKCHGDLMTADQRIKELETKPSGILPTPAPWEGAP